MYFKRQELDRTRKHWQSASEFFLAGEHGNTPCEISLPEIQRAEGGRWTDGCFISHVPAPVKSECIWVTTASWGCPCVIDHFPGSKSGEFENAKRRVNLAVETDPNGRIVHSDLPGDCRLYR